MNTNLPNLKWYALCTRPKSEKKVCAALTKQHIEAYCPQKKSHTQWGFLRKTELNPLFPSTVFVRATEEQFDSIKKTSGVVNFLHWLGAPAVIKDSDIEEVKHFLEAHEDVEVENIPVNTRHLFKVSNTPAQQDPASFNNRKIVRALLPSFGFAISARVDAPPQIEAANSSKMAYMYPSYRVNDAS